LHNVKLILENAILQGEKEEREKLYIQGAREITPALSRETHPIQRSLISVAPQ